MCYIPESNVMLHTWAEFSFLEFSGLFFGFFHFFEKDSKLNGPPGPKAGKLMVAAFAGKGLNVGAATTTMFSLGTQDLSERGTTPSFPWKSLKAMSKLGPSSKIGPLKPLACRNEQTARGF